MADELPTPAAGSGFSTQMEQTSQATALGQPLAGTDSKLAAILEKQAKGETLSARDRGYLGAVKRRGKPKTVAAAPAPNPLFELPQNSDNELFDQTPPAQTLAAAAVATAFDSALLHRVADSILSSVDKATKIIVGYEAKQAGLVPDTVEKYKEAVSLQPENRSLMVENSDPVIIGLAKLFDCAPDKLETVVKSSGLVGGFLAHGFGVYTALKDLREARKERLSQPAPASTVTPQP